MSEFVHLRLHTEYSLLDSVVRVPKLMAAVAQAGMPAIALTDECNLFSMVKFYRAAQKQGLKPIVGVDLRLTEAAERMEPARLTLLCQNLEGYRNLTRLVTNAYLHGERRGLPLVQREWLTADSTRGLLALSGAHAGDVGQLLLNNHRAEACAALEHWLALFGDRFYLEIQRLGRPQDEEHIVAVLELAAQYPVAVVATNDVRFLRREDFEAHEARVCIREGTLLGDPTRARRYTEQQYLRSPQEMATLFEDLPEALQNSVEIARRCSLELKLGESILPEYPVPEGMTTAQYLQTEAARGLAERLGSLAVDAAPYHERLASELQVICSMGFPGYFLIVADFIRWARKNGVPVGPGRGSGAGSLVAWALGITDLDPLAHDLLFERFLNPERVSMPDFDIDFCMEGRDRVIDYVAEKYGRDRVSQIITYGTMAAKAVVRDTGRVLGMSYGFCDRIAKLIPFELGMTLDKALEQEPELKRLYGEEGDVRELIDLARSLEGLTRNAGTHAGGVVIAPSVLTDFAPLYCEEGSTSVVTQFDKDDVEAAGLVKFDFLGLRTLTIIDWAVHIINAQTDAAAGGPQAPLDITAIPMDDAATFSLLKGQRTNAVFQLESRGMKDLIRRLQPDRFEDIVALVALFRPGPLQSGMVDDFIARKHDRTGQAIDYLHPDLKPVLAPTYGVILYQEQVMQIAQVLAGYTLGGADLLRRAMGKKKPEEMAKQRSIFMEGAVSRGVDARRAEHIFDLMEKFAGYGFNKSHSAAYALLSYQTAWLKTHHPEAFMAAVLSSDMDRTDKVVIFFEECADIGLTVEPPDVNASVYRFTVSGPRRIRYGLGAIKGVGESAVQAIVGEREAHGPYTSLEDLCRRLDLNRVNKRVLEALIRSGSLDSFGGTRASRMHGLATAMQYGEQNTRALSTGQEDLFGLAPAAETAAALQQEPAPLLPEWSAAQLLAGERETLGLYLSGHPTTEYEQELRFLTHGRLGDLAGAARPASNGESGRWQPGRNVTVAGLVREIRKRNNRTTIILEDRSGRMEATFFDEIYQQHRKVLLKDAIVLVEGQLRFDEFIEAWRLNARKALDISEARERQARRLVLFWPQALTDAGAVQKLAGLLRPYAGGQCAVAVKYNNTHASATLLLDEQWAVRPAPALIDQLSDLLGRENLRVLYGPGGNPGRNSGPGTGGSRGRNEQTAH